jgi:hypothetical protein
VSDMQVVGWRGVSSLFCVLLVEDTVVCAVMRLYVGKDTELWKKKGMLLSS